MDQLDLPLDTPDMDLQGSALGRAIEQWRSGRPIPLTLATELMSQGYDLPALERRHMNI